MTVLRGLSDEQVDQMVRKNQKSFEITVDVSPSARAALIEKIMARGGGRCAGAP